MLIHLSVIIFSLCVGHTVQAAVGPQCFNYEAHDHRNLVPVLNQSLVNYDHLEINARHAAIPVLAAPPHSVGISLMHHGLPPILWQHGVFALVGGPLNWQQACQMAMNRRALGIRVKFQHPAAIAAVALGIPPAAAAPLAGMAPAAFLVYLNQALGGGGYLTPQASALYRIRHNLPAPNFMLIPGGAGVFANCVIIHFHGAMRVSKNLKELSYNARPAPAVGGLAYLSIKDRINIQFAAAGLPAPSSATIVSADFLQAD